MIRAIKLTLKYLTKSKHNKIIRLLEAYRPAVNFYLQSLWTTKGKLDSATENRLINTRLTARYRSKALKQALDLVITTKKSLKKIKKWGTLPKFKGNARLDAKFVTIEDGRGSFDLIIKLSTLQRGKRIVIPTKKTRVLNKWLSKPGAKLLQAIELSETNLIVYVDIPDQLPKEGKTLGIDLGINKLICSYDGTYSHKYGTDLKRILKKIKNKKQGSKAQKRARIERDNYCNYVINSLPWNEIKYLGIEDLKLLKQGKKGRGREFRQLLAPWTYGKVLTRLGCKAEENRVLLVPILPEYTSQSCPQCNTVCKENRIGECFCCRFCNYKNDADIVGAMNIFERTMRFLPSLESGRQ